MADPTPVLAYADCRPGQPIGSTFTLRESADRVVLTKPLRPDYVTAFVATLVAVGVYGFVIAGTVWALSDLHRHLGDWIGIAFGLLGLATLGTLVLAHVRHTAARTLALTVDRRGLTVVNGPVTLTGRPWCVPEPRHFRASLGQPDLLRGCIAATVLVRTRFGFERTVVANLPKVECVWLADVLNAAWVRLATTPDPSPAEPETTGG